MSDIYTHVQALNTCHLCTIAARLGRVIKWDPVNEQILDDDQATTRCECSARAVRWPRQQRKQIESCGSRRVRESSWQEAATANRMARPVCTSSFRVTRLCAASRGS